MRPRSLALAASLLAASCGAEPADPLAPPPDPVRERTLREIGFLRTGPLFADLDLRFHDFRPFLLAEEAGPGEPAGEAAGRALLDLRRDLRAFLLGAGVDAPPPEERGDERLRWVILADRGSFERWHAKARIPLPGSGEGYFQAGKDLLVMAHRGALDARAVRQLGFHQLLHFHRRTLAQRDDDARARERGEAAEPVTREDPRLRSAFAWFDRGLAQALAAPAAGPAEARAPGPPDAGTLAFLRGARDAGILWPLEDFLFADGPGIAVRARVRGGGAEPADPLAVHGAQSWLLVDTLLHDGRWRPGFLAMVRNEAAARSGRPYLLEAFGLPPRAGAPGVEAWIREVEGACLRRLDAAPR